MRLLAFRKRLENVRVKGEGEILFARKFDGDILGANGTLIRKIKVTIQ